MRPPLTYPSILANIIVRGYPLASEKYLKPAELGTVLIRQIRGHFGFLDTTTPELWSRSWTTLPAAKPPISPLSQRLMTAYARSWPKRSSHRNRARSRSEIWRRGARRSSKGRNRVSQMQARLISKPIGKDSYGCRRFRDGSNFGVNTFDLSDSQLGRPGLQHRPSGTLNVTKPRVKSARASCWWQMGAPRISLMQLADRQIRSASLE